MYLKKMTEFENSSYKILFYSSIIVFALATIVVVYVVRRKVKIKSHEIEEPIKNDTRAVSAYNWFFPAAAMAEETPLGENSEPDSERDLFPEPQPHVLSTAYV
jgi:uncharacterized membrane protein YcgQ (UPF0703/DUF1980 family)